MDGKEVAGTGTERGMVFPAVRIVLPWMTVKKRYVRPDIKGNERQRSEGNRHEVHKDG
ncbi:MAG: hypothetical protein V8S98_05150 [Lachnospiraceae bacterium]